MLSILGPQRSSVAGEPPACVAGYGSKQSEWPSPGWSVSWCEGGTSGSSFLSMDIRCLSLRCPQRDNLKDMNTECLEDRGSSGSCTHHCPLGTVCVLGAKP